MNGKFKEVIVNECKSLKAMHSTSHSLEVNFNSLYETSDVEDCDVFSNHISDHGSSDQLMTVSESEDSDYELSSNLGNDVLSDCEISSSGEYEVCESKSEKIFSLYPPSPVWLQEKEIPNLELPKSSNDLLVPVENVLLSLSIYETLKHFRCLVRLSPFLLEDFCAAVVSDDLSTLFSEIHIQLLKCIIREDEKQQTTFTAHEQKDSLNIQFFCIDGYTWPEILRLYLQSDAIFKPILSLYEKSDYPFCDMIVRLQILQFLCDQFLSTQNAREYIYKEGNLQYDDHCRVCHKFGDLLCCETCSATYHLECVYPPLQDVPEGEWKCSVCASHELDGVTNCEMENEKGYCRKEPLGCDRHGRKYWFVSRRIIVESETEQCWYYSSEVQFEQLLSVFDKEKYELKLYHRILELKDVIINHMLITQKLTDKYKGTRKSYLEIENDIILEKSIFPQHIQEKLMKNSSETNSFVDKMQEDSAIPSSYSKIEVDSDIKEIVTSGTYNCDENENKAENCSNGEDSLLEKKVAEVLSSEILTRKKSQQIASGTYIFKLGMEGNYQKYVNQYSVNNLALNKVQHQEDKDRKRYLSHKFSLSQQAEFKWASNIYGSKDSLITCLRLTLSQFENSLPTCYMHCNWPLLRKPWQSCIAVATELKDFIRALLVFVACIRPVVFNSVWLESLGYTQLHRVTITEKEERKKQEKRDQKDREIEEERNKILYSVKYTKRIKHTLWKLKGEEYRIHGQWGWRWLSNTRLSRFVDASKKGLRAGPYKFQAYKKSEHGIEYVEIDTQHYNLYTSSHTHVTNEDIRMGILKSLCNIESENERSNTKIFPIVPDKQSFTLVNVSKGLSSYPRSLYPKIASHSKLDDLLDHRKAVKKEDLTSHCHHASLDHEYMDVTTIKSEIDSGVSDDSLLETKSNEVKIITSDPFVADLFLTAQQDHMMVANKILALNRMVSLLEHISSLKCYNNACQKQKCYSPSCREMIFLKHRQNEVRSFIEQLKKNLSNKSSVDEGDKINLDEIQSSYVCTKDKFFLKKSKLISSNSKKKLVKYPQNSIFRTRIGRRSSILILAQHELNSLARKGGLMFSSCFNNVIKGNLQVWPYPCGRPLFKTSWLYRTTQVSSLSGIALQLRVLWTVIRWDDLLIRAPTCDAKKQITTETELITSEILKSVTEGRFNELTKYLVRKVHIPLDVPKQIRESTPSFRTGLRKRRHLETQGNPVPQVIEEWIEEEQLELWEIRQFSERSKSTLSYLTRTKVGLLEKGQDVNTDILKSSDEKMPKTFLGKKFLESSMNDNLKTTVSTEIAPDGKTFKKFTLTPSYNNTEVVKSVLQSTPQGQTSTTYQMLTLSDGRRVIIPKMTQQNIDARPYPEQIIIPSLVNLPPNKKIIINHMQEKNDSNVSPKQIVISKCEDGKIIIRGLQPGQQVKQLPDGRLQIFSSYNKKSSLVNGDEKTKMMTVRLPAKEVNGPEPLVHIVQSACGTRVVLQGADLNSLTAEQLTALQTNIKLFSNNNRSSIIKKEIKRRDTRRIIGRQNFEKKDCDIPNEKFVVTADYVSETIKQALKTGNLAPDIEHKLIEIQKKQKRHFDEPSKKFCRKEMRGGAEKKSVVMDKLQSLLFRHKELLRKEIMKKRHVMENLIEEEIKKEMDNRIKSCQPKPNKKNLTIPSPKQSNEVVERLNKFNMELIDAKKHREHKKEKENIINNNSLEMKRKKKIKLYCICKTPFDETRFYVGCDVCNNWFHGDCVGVTEAMSKKMAEYICKECRDKQEKYCLCCTPYDDTMFYICCDKCQDWFHGRCVGIVQGEADEIEEYLCPRCSKDTPINKANLKVLGTRDWLAIQKAFEIIKQHRNAVSFIMPVDPKSEPRYYQVVKEPMDLETIESRISRKKYKTLSEFVSDMTKIFDNCRYYYSANSKMLRSADVLEAFFLRQLKLLRQKLLNIS